MLPELVKILSLQLRETWKDGNLVRTDIIDASGQAVTPDRMPAKGSYEHFAQLLQEKGYAILPALSFAPGPAVLPTSLAVVGEAPPSVFERSVDSALQQASLGLYKKGFLYSDSYNSAHNSSLRSGLWFFQQYNLAIDGTARGECVLFGTDGATSPDAFSPGIPTIEAIVGRMEVQRYVTLVSMAEFRQGRKWAVPLSIIVASNGRLPQKTAWNEVIEEMGLPLYSSGKFYSSGIMANSVRDAVQVPA
ncbi:hypothetical protein HYY73_05960 [Candidatus Woesearchaeota archaeon]|nr:hypothetical protein [Candidatus Woesearchaeota archaeon]